MSRESSVAIDGSPHPSSRRTRRQWHVLDDDLAVPQFRQVDRLPRDLLIRAEDDVYFRGRWREVFRNVGGGVPRCVLALGDVDGAGGVFVGLAVVGGPAEDDVGGDALGWGVE